VQLTGHLTESDTNGRPPGEPSVLVTYASRFGSTAGVAERIAERLTEHGSHVELSSVDEVEDVSAYDAVVFGSAVFNQRWMPEAEEFVRRSLGALADCPVWLFSVGTFGDSKRLIGPLMKREPKDIRDLERAVHPRDYRVFAGVIDRHQWPFFSRVLYHALGGRLGDNRDWASIDAWALEISRTLDSSKCALSGKRPT